MEVFCFEFALNTAFEDRLSQQSQSPPPLVLVRVEGLWQKGHGGTCMCLLQGSDAGRSWRGLPQLSVVAPLQPPVWVWRTPGCVFVWASRSLGWPSACLDSVLAAVVLLPHPGLTTPCGRDVLVPACFCEGVRACRLCRFGCVVLRPSPFACSRRTLASGHHSTAFGLPPTKRADDVSAV